MIPVRVVHPGCEEERRRLEKRRVLRNRCMFVSTTFAYIWIATCVLLAGRPVVWTILMMFGAAFLFSKSLVSDQYYMEAHPPADKE